MNLQERVLRSVWVARYRAYISRKDEELRRLCDKLYGVNGPVLNRWRTFSVILPLLPMFRTRGVCKNVQRLIQSHLNAEDCLLLLLAHSSQQNLLKRRLFDSSFLQRCRKRGYIELGRWAIQNGCVLEPSVDPRTRWQISDDIVEWCFWNGTVLGAPPCQNSLIHPTSIAFYATQVS